MVLTFLGSLESVSKACKCIHWTLFKIKESISTHVYVCIYTGLYSKSKNQFQPSQGMGERERERERGSRKYPQLEVPVILQQTTLKNENQSF
jgi:hypothetical protein